MICLTSRKMLNYISNDEFWMTGFENSYVYTNIWVFSILSKIQVQIPKQVIWSNLEFETKIKFLKHTKKMFSK